MKKLVLILVSLCSLSALACTTFVLQDGGRVYFGRNLDWDWSDGIVLVNPRNLQKRAFVLSTNDAMWTAKHGSVTFNQFGRELPFGGMNEAGLVVENMWLAETQYPPADSRPEINMLQWIQYQLDNFSTVQEVIDSNKKVRLENTPTRARIHYLVCDARGNVATIEFLNGSMRVHQGDDLACRALANDTYEKSLAAHRAEPSRGDLSKPLSNKSSFARFSRAAERAKAFESAEKPAQDVTYAFETLEEVSQGGYTVWQIVYDVTQRRIHFRTRKNSRERTLDLKGLNFACNKPLLFADIHSDAGASGAVEFRELVASDHRAFLRNFYTQDAVKQMVGDLTPMVEPLLLTVDSYRCVEK